MDTSTDSPTLASEPRHPIRVVAQRTGLTPATLRAWERRYQVVEPHRSEGGQRLYSDQDVERLVRLRLLSEAGRPISLVAALDDDEALALLQEDRESRAPGTVFQGATEAVAGRTASRMVDTAFQRTLAMDAEGLEAALRRSAVTLGAHPFLQDVVTPLLHRVGTAWARDELGPAEEHLCTGVVERVLAWLAEPASSEPGAPRMVVATLPGERHGLGARLVAAAAGLEGWHVTDLGIDLPPRDIAHAARTLGASVVALSLVNADGLREVPRALRELAESLPDDVVLLLGGAMAARLAEDDLPEGAQVVRGLTGLRDALLRLA